MAGSKSSSEGWAEDQKSILRHIMLAPHGNARLAWTFLGLLAPRAHDSLGMPSGLLPEAICWDLVFIPLQMFDINELDELINVATLEAIGAALLRRCPS